MQMNKERKWTEDVDKKVSKVNIKVCDIKEN